MNRVAPALIALATLLALPVARAEEPVAPDPPGPFRKIRVVDFEGAIEPVLAAYARRQLEAAEREGVDCIVLRIESPGGRVDSTLELGDRLLQVPKSIHTVAWVEREAYSGAAMTALACREIVMGANAHLGDAQPITLDEQGLPKPVGEKLESPLRAKAREALKGER